MLALMGFAVPDEQTAIEGILELALQIALRPLPARLSFDDLANVSQGMLAGGIEFINPANDRAFLRTRFQGTCLRIGAIAERSAARVQPLRGFLAQTFLDLFPQVFDVIAGNDQLDAVNKLGLRFRVFADDLAFFGKVNLNIQVFQRDAI